MGRDSGIGLGLLALCAVIYWQTGFIRTPPFVPIGPAFYPRVLLVLLSALAVWLIVEDLVAAPRRKPRAATTPPAHRPNYRLVAIAYAFFGTYIAGLSLLGYLASTFLFVLALAWVLSPRRRRELPKLVVVALGTTAATYLVFEKYLRVFLPRGLLF